MLERYDLYTIKPELGLRVIDRAAMNNVWSLSIMGDAFRMLVTYDPRADTSWLFSLLADQSKVVGEIYRGIDGKHYSNLFTEVGENLPLISDGGLLIAFDQLPPREWE